MCSFFLLNDATRRTFLAWDEWKVNVDSITPVYINEQDAVKKLMKLETWLAFTTRDFTVKERQNLVDRKYMPRAIPIAYDGLAIIVNNANPDTCITIKDFARILRGEVVAWKDLDPQSKLGEIDVVAQPKQNEKPQTQNEDSVQCRHVRVLKEFGAAPLLTLLLFLQ